MGAEVARAVHERAAAESVEAVTDPLPSGPRAGAVGTLVLHGAYLVSPASLDAFRRAFTDVERQYGARGFRFEFTGPWPTYHFVRDAEPAQPSAPAVVS